jgi:hypothetical protein
MPSNVCEKGVDASGTGSKEKFFAKLMIFKRSW